MADIVVYSSGFCPYCQWAKRLLDEKNVDYTEIRIDQVDGAQHEMIQKSKGITSVPQIFIGNTHVGGYDDMAAMDRAGNLDALIAS